MGTPKVNRPVEVVVEWGYDLHVCPIPMASWNRVKRGAYLRRLEPYWYEGERFVGEWHFNQTSPGSLLVQFGDGGVGFDGALDDAIITVSGKTVAWP